MYIIETENLSYSFGKKVSILHNLQLQVPQGSIYGFLGPNGAGKTTTLRLILGLLRLKEGAISIFGKSLKKNRIAILKQLGTLIESPSIYEHLTATENLHLLQRVYQCPTNRIPEALKQVGLSDTANKKVKQFSLGMKQRLAIAIALLHNPSLLILDEPTNGLDPNGMIEIRELLKDLNQQQGISILVSSHLLAEIEKLVTYVGVINKGELVFQGTLEKLLKKQMQTSLVKLQTSNNSKSISILNSNNYISNSEGDKIVVSIASKEQVAQLNKLLVYEGIDVFELVSDNSDLESVFMNLINS